MKSSVLILSFFALGAFAQTPTLMPTAIFQGLSNQGRPLPGGLLYTCVAGSVCPGTPLTTYKDIIGTPNSNPVVLDAGGFASVWIQQLPYKMVLTDSSGNVVWTQDNVESPTLAGAVIPTTNITYLAPFNGSVGINLGTYLLSSEIDVRSFGAQGFTGNCHSLTADDQPQIQAALNYAFSNGPAEVYLPPGFCWPIGSHLWIPPGVHLYGSGRTFGYEISSAGSLLIANANWASNNTSFPYSQMLWVTGRNQTSGTYIASGGNFGSVVNNLEINCNDQVGCGNFFGAGRQEKSRLHDLTFTGGVPFGGGYSYGFYEEGVDCNNTGSGPNAPPGNGCLVIGDGTGNPFSGQQGPDERLEIFPSYNVPSANFIPWALMGANNYKGLRDSTINGDGAGIPYGEYFWGEATTMGPGIHTEGLTASNSLYIGNIPAGSTCNGGTTDTFVGFDAPITIAACAAQVGLSFVNIAGGVVNNQTGAPVTSTTQPDYYYSFTNQNSGSVGTGNPQYTNAPILLQDPAEYIHNSGYNGINFFNGTTRSGLVAQPLLDTASLFTRAHVSSDLWWDHANGVWDRGSNGGNDFASLGFLNGGSIGFCTDVSAPSTVAMISWFDFCHVVVSGNGHLLVGGGWINHTTGAVQGEGSDPVQVNGNINMINGGVFTGTAQFAASSSSSCPTGTSDGATCTFGVNWPVSYATTGYKVTCTLMDPTGSPHMQGVTRSTGSVTVTIQNGSAAQAVASGGSGVSCWATP